jgi:hypothetical protein
MLKKPSVSVFFIEEDYAIMAFKVKNLMIQVLPDAPGKAQPQPGLAFANACVCLAVWSAIRTEPPNCRIGTVFQCQIGPEVITLIHLPFAPSNPEDLATLKAQLQDALTQVEAQEKALNEQMAPQTLEEAKALEGHLVDALAEVRQRIGELQNKAGGGQG